MTAYTAISQLLDNHGVDLSWQQGLYEHLHANPELSLEEEQTAERIAEKLSEFTCQVVRNIGGHGLVGIFSNGPGPTVLFRADFDGLPVTETSGAPYASTKVVTRVDGSTTGVMHACGHDMHTTSLLGACAILDARRDAWSGTFIALFQPAEEISAGAENMVNAGLATKIPTPDVCLGQHVIPGPAGHVMTMPGPTLAACDTITVTLFGRSAHGSMPHNSIDPTYLASLIVVRLQGIVAREVSPFDFAVVSVGTLSSGNTNNTIPAEATLVLNCRFYSEAVRDKVYAAIERVVRAEAAASGCEKDPVIEWSCHGELTDNDHTAFETVRPVFDEVFGEDSVNATPWTASEDFSNIPRHFGCPYLFWMVGVTPRAQWDAAVAQDRVAQLIPGNHMGDFLPDYEPSMRACTLAATAGVLAYLAPKA
ncbi:amidohydrolase [Corynebacterium aquilae]|uniref:Metal-dependent amidase/aminoacylase/carboxypeptidase n=1 Tax=Corynebacterium aquilae DSM 44791 TaxID=1431546 RepID=A0A1L7CGQ3_9CORY|nr:amidohydrolase [Corynebacterium aquilae]APT85041.1 metal-dependent amidase/aminoacylase/carboxypeptidase [Corynebacterium aquilae DSM 44791]